MITVTQLAVTAFLVVMFWTANYMIPMYMYVFMSLVTLYTRTIAKHDNNIDRIHETQKH